MTVSTHVPHRSRLHRRRFVPVLACLTLGGVLLAACGSDDDTTTEQRESDDSTTTPLADTANESTSSTNCGIEVSIEAPPERTVTMNQAATEVMLALGLQDRMVGTAYLDDEILPELAEVYAEVPVLSDRYPSSETVLDTEPDLIYASYPSAFQPENAGERADLAELGIATYLSPAACPGRSDDEPLDIEAVWQEIEEIGARFGVADAADDLVAAQRAELQEALDVTADHSSTTVMWWDNSTDAPSVGVCCGAPGMIMDAAGVRNAFADEAGSWAAVSWEQVVERDPDVIVLVDSDWSTAEDKRSAIESTPAVDGLRAVRNEQYVVIPFSATTPGIRNVSAVVALAEGLEVLR
ncbi:ABC transporter substrate-binding protein [Phytoactinopolyspora limicola]|uniref:ABC transporter substrate-binding protein n=1 Tax=Phytoactinopolyspora limicola TaxID=2715536 RepID=UPI00140AF185|nr:ABC transporter substrate-binding protein [Phytoactinopolyspora limicola]